MSFEQLKTAFDSQQDLKFNAKAWRQRLKYLESLRRITKYNNFVFEVNGFTGKHVLAEIFMLHLLRGLFTGKQNTVSKRFNPTTTVRIPHLLIVQRHVTWGDTQTLLELLVDYALYMNLVDVKK